MYCDALQGLAESFVKDANSWKPLYDSSSPASINMPHGFELLAPFRKVLIVRCIRWELGPC